MTPNSSKPLDGIDPESITPDAVDEEEVCAALSSSKPLVQQRGVAVCETLATDDVDAVRPFLDKVASLADDSNAAIALRAIAVLDAVAESAPATLEGRLAGLLDALDSDIVDVQLTGATVLGKLVVERPDLLAPAVRKLVKAVRETEPDAEQRGLGDVIDDRVTLQTIQEHEEGERQRRTSGRRTLINVIVAVTEVETESVLDGQQPAPDAAGQEPGVSAAVGERSSTGDEIRSRPLVDDLVALLDDVDPAVAGGAIDALGELAAANPDVVAPASDRLLDCLGHERPFVRARAIRTLGQLGDDAAVPKLRTVAETDDDEDVRELAEETADFLAGTS